MNVHIVMMPNGYFNPHPGSLGMTQNEVEKIDQLTQERMDAICVAISRAVMNLTCVIPQGHC
jgi:hypothetical protein